MKISDLYRMSKGDKTYLFPEPVGDQRRVSGEPTHKLFEDLGIVTLKQERQQKFVVGTLVFDPSISKTKYCLYRLNEGEDFLDDPNSYNLDRISTLQKAKNVEEEIRSKLKKLGQEVYVLTDVKELPPYGFEVRVSVAHISKRLLNDLEGVLSKMESAPTTQQS